MAKERYKAIVEVHALIVRANKILLGKRQNTGYRDGDFHFPAGHLEVHENFVDALIREAKEELGVALQPGALNLAYVLHHNERVGLFFFVESLGDEPHNMEPEKCSALQWFNLHELPENMVPYAKFVIEDINHGKKFGVYTD